MDFFGPILTEDARVGIKDKYKYTSSEYTPLDNIMNHYWNWFANTFFPMWMAPNLVTMMGFVVMVSSFVVSLYYPMVDPGNVPQWTFLYHAFALFFYQTMDACDGKQARRTKSSSALGQLFDHGCDSMTTLFSTVPLCASLGLSHHEMLILVSGTLASFFVAQWAEHFTHVLSTSIGGIYGVTEAQLTIVWVHLTAYFFPKFLDAAASPLVDLPALGLPFEMPPAARCIYMFSLLVVTASMFSAVIPVGLKHKGSIAMLVPVLVTCGAALYLATATELCGNECHRPKFAPLHSTMLTLTVGFTSTQSSNRIIIASVAKVRYSPAWQIGHVLLPLLAVAVAGLGDHSIGGYQYPLLLVALIVSVLTTFRHCIGAANELCELLCIRLFVIKPVVTE